MNNEETMAQLKPRVLWTSKSNGVAPHLKFRPSIETQDLSLSLSLSHTHTHTHTHTQRKGEAYSHIMKFSWLTGIDSKDTQKQFKREQETDLGMLL